MKIMMKIDFLGLLQIAFIVLKLTNVIAWSWFWVFSPILIPLGILGVILLIAAAAQIVLLFTK